MSAPAEMETALAADLVTADGRRWDYQVWLTWNPAEPWAVMMTLPSAGRPTEWLFALNLLGVGLHGPVGDGDVRLSPAPAGVPEPDQVELSVGTDRYASVFLDREPVAEFLDAIAPHLPGACAAARAEIDAELAWLIDDPDGQWSAPGGEGR